MFIWKIPSAQHAYALEYLASKTPGISPLYIRHHYFTLGLPRTAQSMPLDWADCGERKRWVLFELGSQPTQSGLRRLGY